MFRSASAVSFASVGQGASRGEHYCFGFPVGTPGRPATGTGGILIATRDLPRPNQYQAAAAAPADAATSDAGDGIAGVAASVVGRVEQVLAEAGDYAAVLRRLEQLAETTMHAQALIHEVAGQAEASSPQPLIALTPLAQNIIELERILMPASARLDTEIAGTLPPAYCDPVVRCCCAASARRAAASGATARSACACARPRPARAPASRAAKASRALTSSS